MDEINLLTLFFSFRGISYIIGTGVLGVQQKVIYDQRDTINTYEDYISNTEPLLKAIIERTDTPQDIKELAQKTIKKLKSKEE